MPTKIDFRLSFKLIIMETSHHGLNLNEDIAPTMA